jgi:hypothetical protein
VRETVDVVEATAFTYNMRLVALATTAVTMYHVFWLMETLVLVRDVLPFEVNARNLILRGDPALSSIMKALHATCPPELVWCTDKTLVPLLPVFFTHKLMVNGKVNRLLVRSPTNSRHT